MALLEWGAGTAAVALVAIAVRVEFVSNKLTQMRDIQLKGIQDDVAESLEMHRHPDDYGFGTKETNRALESATGVLEEVAKTTRSNAWAVRDLIHYLKEDFEARTGAKLPPPAPELRD